MRAGIRLSPEEVKGWPNATRRQMSDWKKLVCVEDVVNQEWYTSQWRVRQISAGDAENSEATDKVGST